MKSLQVKLVSDKHDEERRAELMKKKLENEYKMKLAQNEDEISCMRANREDEAEQVQHLKIELAAKV